MIRKEYSFPSKTGTADIFARSWSPDDKDSVKAVIQITHGMAEDGERYEDFASFLCENGIAVYLNDHVGHGKSVKSDDDLGWFGDEGKGWDAFVEDARTFTKIAKDENPGKPLIFFGHSMGSFVAREYARRYGRNGDIKAAVFCGTSGSNPGAPAGIILASLVAKIKGGHFRSKLIDNIAFGTYLKGIENPRTNFDWLTKDTEIVDKYVASKYCGFLFTAAGFKDMFTILKTVSGKDWYADMDKSLPILIISGKLDPVGAYGKGITQVYNDLKQAGKTDVTMKLYEGDRHEILNETDRSLVYKDVLAWILSKI